MSIASLVEGDDSARAAPVPSGIIFCMMRWSPEVPEVGDVVGRSFVAMVVVLLLQDKFPVYMNVKRHVYNSRTFLRFQAASMVSRRADERRKRSSYQSESCALCT